MKTATEEKFASIAYNARHRPADAQWLGTLLYRKAKGGDRRARRLLAKLLRLLQGWGANVPPPTWPSIKSPERRKELDR